MQFKKRRQLFIRAHSETLSVVAMRVSNPDCSPVGIIEVMADERWARLAEQQGVAYAKTVAEAMNLKVDMDNPADREKLRRAVLDLVAGRKMPKQKVLG